MPRAGALLVAVAAVLLTFLAGPAAAHSEEGQMTVVSATESEPMTISAEVGLVYSSDQHLAEEAEVWVDASTDGTQLEPVRLTRAGQGSSVYAGQIPVPTAGEWTLAFESTNPTATAQATVTVEGAPAETTTSSTAAPATEPSTTAPASDDGEAASAEVDEEDDGLSAVVIALVVVGLLVLLAAGFAVAQRRRDTDPSDRA